MSPQAFRTAILERGERYVLEAILLESKPVLFAARPDYNQWRDQVARAAKLRDEQVFLMGSAVTGFSIAPTKYGRAFASVATTDRPASDLDLAIIDGRLFHECWAATLYEDRRARLALNVEEKEKLMQDVYYGFITDKVTPRSAKVFQRIIALRSTCGRHPVSSGIRLSLRVYHRQDDFVGYQVASLRSLKRSFRFKNI